ncbi:MAG: DUF58 domain-containing protein [Spirochaetaceae bacterium]|nr:MAG: DUF58 domain-containing protein [Spirochaetaceae bacterium]
MESPAVRSPAAPGVSRESPAAFHLRCRFFFALLITLPAGVVRREPVSLLVGIGILGLMGLGSAVSILRVLGRRELELDIRFDPPVLSRGEGAEMIVSIREGYLPAGTIIPLVLRSGTRAEIVSIRVDRTLSPVKGGPRRFSLPVLPRGVYRPEEVRPIIPDPLGISTVSPPCTVQAGTLRVMPRARPLNMTETFQGEGVRTPSPTLRWSRSGERVDVRPYVPGDDISRIHWKVYAHTGELFFRIPEELPPPAQAVRLVVEANQRDEALLDQVIEYALGLAETLMARDHRVLLLVRTREGGAPATIPAGSPPEVSFPLAALDHEMGIVDRTGWTAGERPEEIREGIILTTEEAWIVLVPEGGKAGAAQRVAPLDRDG